MQPSIEYVEIEGSKSYPFGWDKRIAAVLESQKVTFLILTLLPAFGNRVRCNGKLHGLESRAISTHGGIADGCQIII